MNLEERQIDLSRRRGLAPLELVLCLPLLLCVMALMVNYGTAVCWKVRGLTNSRNAAFRERWPRSGQRDGNPRYWPAPASVGVADGNRVARLDLEAINKPVARGALPNGIRVDAELLDPTRGIRLGTADIERRMTMLPKLGTYEFHLKHPLFDDAWQFQRMPRLPANVWRRIPTLWMLPQTDQSLPAAFVNAVQQILFASFREGLRPLDRDDDFIRFRGYARDFHPQLPRFCSIEREPVRGNEVQRLIHHIRGHCVTTPNERCRILNGGVMLNMTDSFIALYQGKIDEIKANMMNPRPTPAMAAEFALLPGLEQNVAQLKAFREYAIERICEECETR